MLPLRVRLLGSFSAKLGSQPIASLYTPRLSSLLAYLLLHDDHPALRHRIAAQFWPDSTDSQARTNLRNLFFHLRQALPDAKERLISDEATIGCNPAAPLDVDVADFKEALAQARLAQQRQNAVAERQALWGAVDSFTGRLLPGCYDDWIIPYRESIDCDERYALARLATLESDNGNYADATDLAQRLIAVNPLEEEPYRQLMRICLASGNRATGIQAYHACAEAQETQLGVGVDPRTYTLYQALIGDHAPPVGRRSPPASDLVAGMGSVPIGRQDAWGALGSAWQRCQLGHPVMMLLSGEAGIGKTHLAKAFVASVAKQGYATAVSHSFPHDAGPLMALSSLLTSGRIWPCLSTLDPRWRTEIARLIPELGQDLPQVMPGAGTGWQRRHFFDALTHGMLAAGEPLLLLFDDAHWCDDQTLHWIRHLMRRYPKARVMLAMIFDDAVVTTGHPMRDLQLELAGEADLTVLSLERLNVLDTARVAAQLVGRPLGDAQAQELYNETEGNPLYIAEKLLASGDHARPGAEPSAGEAIILRRLAALSLAARRLVDLGATVGRSFSYKVMALASGKDAGDLVDALDELWRRRVVRETGRSSYEFSHGRIRQLAYEQMSEARRALLHRNVAEALAKLASQGHQIRAMQVAQHWEYGGAWHQAVLSYQQAAEQAMRVYAVSDAVDSLERALELSCRHDADWPTRARIYASLTKALEAAGRHQEAYQAHCARERNAVQEDDAMTEVSAILGQARMCCCATRLFRPDQAEIDAKRALTLARTLGDRETEIDALKLLLIAPAMTSRPAEGRRYGEEALAIAQSLGMHDRVAQIQASLVWCAYIPMGHVELAIEMMDECMAHAETQGDKEHKQDLLMLSCYADVRAGEYDRVLQSAREVQDAARDSGNTWRVAQVLAKVALVHWDRGELTQALDAFEQAFVLGTEAGYTYASTTGRVLWADAFARMGVWDRAMDLAQAALDHAEARLPQSRLLVLGTLAGMQVWAGLGEQADRTIALGRADYRFPGRQGAWLRLQLAALELALDRGQTDLAVRLASELTPRGLLTMAGLRLDVAWLKARSEYAQGNIAAAKHDLMLCRDKAERLGSRRILWRILYTLSQWASDAEASSELLAQSQRIIAEMADRIADPPLRQSFLAQPRIRQVLQAESRYVPNGDNSSADLSRNGS